MFHTTSLLHHEYVINTNEYKQRPPFYLTLIFLLHVHPFIPVIHKDTMSLSRKITLLVSFATLSLGNAFTVPNAATTQRTHTTTATALYMASRKKGSAKSNEADLEKTVNLILQHIEGDEKRTEAKRKREDLLEEKRARRVQLPELINTDNQIMLRSKRGSDTPSTDRGISFSVPVPEVETDSSSGLDEMLSKLTSLFPVFVLSSAIVGMKKPSALTWVNKGQIIPIMLSAV